MSKSALFPSKRKNKLCKRSRVKPYQGNNSDTPPSAKKQKTKKQPTIFLAKC